MNGWATPQDLGDTAEPPDRAPEWLGTQMYGPADAAEWVARSTERQLAVAAFMSEVLGPAAMRELLL